MRQAKAFRSSTASSNYPSTIQVINHYLISSQIIFFNLNHDATDDNYHTLIASSLNNVRVFYIQIMKQESAMWT